MHMVVMFQAFTTAPASTLNDARITKTKIDFDSIPYNWNEYDYRQPSLYAVFLSAILHIFE